MKNLEKLLMVIFMMTMASMAFSQTFGVKAGLNLSNMLIKDNTTTYSTDFKMNPGFHVGATVEFPFGEVFSLEPGLLLTTKGYKFEDTYDLLPDGKYNYTMKLNNYYLEIPLYAKAGFDVGNARIYGALGPYVGVGLWGKIVTEIEGQDKEKENVKWGSNADEDDLKRFDFGMTAGVGFEFSSFLLEVSYGYGLTNLSPYTTDGLKMNNRVLGISAGYKF